MIFQKYPGCRQTKLLGALLAVGLAAQAESSPVAPVFAEGGPASSVGEATAPSGKAAKKHPKGHSLPPGAWDLGPGVTWTSLGSVRDHLGTHTRWAQNINGIPVLGSEMITHEQGGVAQPPTCSLALARGEGGVPRIPPILGAEAPALTGERAGETLLARFGPRAQPPRLSKARRVLFPVMRSLDLARPGETDALAMPRVVMGYVLAYVIEVRWPGGPHDLQDTAYVLNAHTGRVLEERLLVQNADTPGRIRIQPWHGRSVELEVTFPNGGPRPMQRDPHRGLEGGNTVEDLLGQWDPRLARVIEWGGGSPEDTEKTAASAAFALAASWDYFTKVHGRHGYDDKGGRVRVLINDGFPDNANWESVDGVGTIRVGRPRDFEPWVHPAILGHEFTHGVVKSRAKLDGCMEAKGLDEGTADFFGQMIDTWSRTGGGNPATLLFGNIIGNRETPWSITMTPLTKDGTGQTRIFRDMAEPTQTGNPDRWNPELGRLADEHAVSGPLGRALCFLSHGAAAVGSPESKRSRSLTGAPSWSSDLLPGGMAGIGNDRAAAIWYTALTEELQPMSDYRDARKAALKVARRLYGEDSREDLAVRDAFGAVGVGKPGRLSDPADAWLPSVAVEAEGIGEDVVLTVTVPDPDQVKSVAFLVDAVQVGKAAAPPFRLRLPASRLLANGTHRFQAALRDVEDNVVQSKEVGFTLANRQQQVLKDPSLLFEDDSAGGWLTDAIPERPALPPPGEAADGWCRRFDAVSHRPGHSPVMEQRLVLPPAHLQLSVWVQVPASPQPGPGDALTIEVIPDGSVPRHELARLTPSAPTDGWARLVFPLDAFAGQSIRLRFNSTFGVASTTVVRVADARILASEDVIP